MIRAIRVFALLVWLTLAGAAVFVFGGTLSGLVSIDTAAAVLSFYVGNAALFAPFLIVSAVLALCLGD